MFKAAWKKIRPVRYGIASTVFSVALQLLGFTSRVLGVVLLGLSIVLFASPAIEAAYGIRLVRTPNSGRQKSRKTTLQLDQPISHVLLLAVIGLAIYAFVTRPRPTVVSAQILPVSGVISARQENLETVVGKRYENQLVILDGHTYVNCTFKNVIFKWNGGPSNLVDAHLETTAGSTIGVGSDNPAIKGTINLLMTLGWIKGNFLVTPVPVLPSAVLSTPSP